LDLQKIKDRKKEYLLITQNGKTREYRSEDIKRVIAGELGNIEAAAGANFVKGKIASRGRVAGPARVVFTKKDYGKIKKGDILVTPMTKPNIVPYLSKVKGIITNDGGALSHASIISREMKIPCIVGTVHATDIFRGGDKVELDANKGIAKIMKQL
jgi:pyruvate,water dikinase